MHRVKEKVTPSHPEVELKLALPEQFLPQIEDIPLLRDARASAKTEQLTSVYFDTRKFKLREMGLSLRVRSDGKRHVQTIKSNHAGAAGVTSRDEWEAEIAGTNPDFRAVRGTSLAPLLSQNLRRALKPIFETQIERTAFPVRAGDASVEIALDHGQIKTGEKSVDVCEIEIELKEGDRAELFRVARAFAKVAPVRLSLLSKSARGYELAEGKPAEAVTANEVLLVAGSSTADAFQAIAESCLYQVAANWEAVCRSDPEGFHQMRVGLRRLRAALSIFSEMLGGSESAQVKRESG